MSRYLFIFLPFVYSLSCKDMSGNDVLWFSMIKIPQSISPTKGLEFMYLDPNTQTINIQKSNINEAGAFSYTLNQINDKTISSFMYNDEPPVNFTGSNLRGSTLAHAKGVVMYNSNQGIYLTHSIPLFPNFTADGLINTTVDYSETIYAQNIMCVSLTSQQLFNLVGVMAIIQPIMYYKHLVLSNDNVTKFTGDILPDLPPSFGFGFIQNDQQFYYIAKSRYSNLYLWDNSVSEFFQTGLRVESWGRPYMASACPPNVPYSVLNIASLKVLQYSWLDTQDHSKWAIIDGANTVCYGDMNRMTSQLGRGGGTLCIKLDWFYNIHQTIITSSNPCNTASASLA